MDALSTQIASRTFATAKRGYDKDTVDSYLAKIGEQVASDLRGRIARGELGAGERLATEEELLAEYGAARNTLREAFRILESEGLIEVRRGRSGGVFIAHPGIDRLARAFAVRLMLDATTHDDLYAARQLIELALVVDRKAREPVQLGGRIVGRGREAAELTREVARLEDQPD